MSVINDGTISLTNGSKTVTGTDSLFLTRAVEAGWLLKISGDPTHYHIEVNATGETTLTILETYGGVTQSGVSYEIIKDYYDYDIPVLSPDMSESSYTTNIAHQRIIDALNSLGAEAHHTQVINKKSLGIPVQNAFFGYQKFTGAVEIDKLILSSQNGDATDNNLVLDLEINGVLQGLNLTVTAGSSSATSASLAYIVQAGQVVRLKWITINEPCSSNWDIDIHYHNSSGLRVYYDFQKSVFGSLYATQVIGAAYKPPNRGKVFGLTYELDDAGEGSDIILELLKDGASLGTPVTVTIPASSKTGYLELSQTEFLTTNNCSIRVNQVGSIVAGNNLKITLHSYHTTA